MPLCRILIPLAIVGSWFAPLDFQFIVAQSPAPQAERKLEITSELLLPMHLAAAKEYTIYTDAERKTQLVLDERPVFNWANTRRSGGQAGQIFLWKVGKQPLAICSMFSFGFKGVPTSRRIVHEWHSLSESKLVALRNGEPSPWVPRAGIRFRPVDSTTPPSSIATRQKLESRRVAKGFDIHSVDSMGQRWPLRMLGAPLSTYECEQGLGVLFAWVGDAGTDPELLMLIEPRLASEKPSWHFAPIRMTDHELFVRRNQQTVWQSIRSEKDTSFYDEPHLYFRFPDKTVELEVSDAP